MIRILSSSLLALASIGPCIHAAPHPAASEPGECLWNSNMADTGTMPEQGPFTLDRVSLSAKQTPGFGGADIFMPQTSEGQKFPGLTMIPGWGGSRKDLFWLAPILASHGFVVMVMDPNWNLDWPSHRSAAMIKALSFLTETSPARDRVDANRMGIWGFSMGGGGTLETAAKLPNLKAAIAVAPWHYTKAFPKITLPTLVITGSKDTVAAPRVHGKPMFDSLKNAPERDYEELQGAEHTAAVKADPRIAQLTLNWIQRFLGSQAPIAAEGPL